MKACCSSPASIRYWLIVSILAWGLLSLIGIYWRSLRPESASTILLAVAIGCFANWHKNRTLHCGITGPVFLLGGATFLLANMQIFHVNVHFVWSLIAIAAAIAFILECWWGSRSVPS